MHIPDIRPSEPDPRHPPNLDAQLTSAHTLIVACMDGAPARDRPPSILLAEGLLNAIKRCGAVVAGAAHDQQVVPEEFVALLADVGSQFMAEHLRMLPADVRGPAILALLTGVAQGCGYGVADLSDLVAAESEAVDC